MNLKDVRELFVGTKDKIFLDSACVGLAPNTAREAIKRFLDLVVNCPARDISEHHMAMDDMKGEAIIEAAKLLNTAPENLTLIESTTHGLNIAANSIPFEGSNEVLICDTEYLQVSIPFAKKHEAGKLKLIPVVPEKKGYFTLKDFENYISKNTKAICLSSVQWCTGQRVFNKQIGELCRRNGVWIIVDGIQEIGALNCDVNLRYCDFYIAGGHKWLNAPYGCGIMYMSSRAQQLDPPHYGYLNLASPPQGWGKFFQEPSQTPFRPYPFPKNAKSFGIGGTGNYPGAIGLSESIKIINQIGRERVEQKVLQLNGFLREQLVKLGAKVLSPEDLDDRSGITIFRLFDSYEQDTKALEFLQDRRIFLSIRYTNGCGGLRVSTHYFNNEDDILRLCSAIASLRR